MDAHGVSFRYMINQPPCPNCGEKPTHARELGDDAFVKRVQDLKIYAFKCSCGNSFTHIVEELDFAPAPEPPPLIGQPPCPNCGEKTTHARELGDDAFVKRVHGLRIYVLKCSCGNTFTHAVKVSDSAPAPKPDARVKD